MSYVNGLVKPRVEHLKDRIEWQEKDLAENIAEHTSITEQLAIYKAELEELKPLIGEG